jgi:hypothetical protein
MRPWGFATLPEYLESLADYCCSLNRNRVSLFGLFFI